MSTNMYAVAAVLAAAVYVIFSSWNKKDAIPIVGRGLLKRSCVAALPRLRELFREGYSSYPNSSFSLQVFPFGKTTVLTSPSLIEEMRRAPDDTLSFTEISHWVIQPDYTMFGTVASDLHPVTVIRNNLTRNLAALLPEVNEETQLAFEENLKLCGDDWTSFPALETVIKIISRVSNRAMVGTPLCNNTEFRDLSMLFASSATMTAFKINFFPKYLHPVVGPLLSPMNAYVKRLARMLKPLVEERWKQLEEFGQDWPDKPNDYLMCLMEAAHLGETVESSCKGLAMRILQFNFATFHTTTMTFTHLLYDLASNPSYITTLREEVEEIIAELGVTKQATQKMRKLDSFLRESARMNPVGISAHPSGSIGLTSMSRYARRSFTFSDGKTVVPKGSVVIASMDHVHRDPTIYPNPSEFQPWRFAGLNEEDKDILTRQYVTTGSDFLAFGHGKRSCPGRFFASSELKAMLCHVIVNYDVKVEGDVRPRNEFLGIGVIPNMKANIMFRRRAR